MSTTLFHYETDKAGRPLACPIAGAHAGLATFLTEEASWTDYVDLLLDGVAEAAKSGKPQMNTGNAYAVTVHGDHATIEHLHRKDHAIVKVPLTAFTQALGEWRAFLVKTSL